jgi:protein disulfide-isomerase-like protein
MYLKVLSNDDASNLSNLLKDGNWMVLYYAEWCGHCQSMKPEWEKLVEKMKDSKQVNLADVKSDVIDSLKQKPQIEGFPTIKMYNKGKEVAKFEDERSVEKMEKFANDNATKSTPSVVVPGVAPVVEPVVASQAVPVVEPVVEPVVASVVASQAVPYIEPTKNPVKQNMLQNTVKQNMLPKKPKFIKNNTKLLKIIQNIVLNIVLNQALNIVLNIVLNVLLILDHH